jgi:two-component system, NtrC family, response regulator AtoC
MIENRASSLRTLGESVTVGGENPQAIPNVQSGVVVGSTGGQSASAMKILVVDDDRVTRELLRASLEREGYQVYQAESAELALNQIQESCFPIILSDINMVGMGGIGLLSELKRQGSDSVVILMTGYGSLEGAIEAIHEGAFDYLSKPLRPSELNALVSRARRHWETRRKPNEKDPITARVMPRSLIGRSARMIQVYKMLAKASMSGSNVLILGESGTGKELVARAIHENSPLREKPFVTLNCGALSENLLESELFGHVKGSFTGAIGNKRGLFDEADGGAIFLDEIGDISPGLQVKLLRVIQEGEFKPVGTSEVRRVKTRIIAATHRNLEEYVRDGKFREDLYYRLKVIMVELPPLRERIEDLPVLVNHFVARFSEKTGKRVTHISEEAMSLLYSYTWPGNIRELEHAVERAVAMTSTSILYPEDFPITIARNNEPATQLRAVSEPNSAVSPRSLEQMERAHIIRVLQEVSFNKSKAAHILGIDRATLYRKAQRYGISLIEPRVGQP